MERLTSDGSMESSFIVTGKKTGPKAGRRAKFIVGIWANSLLIASVLSLSWKARSSVSEDVQRGVGNMGKEKLQNSQV